ncbi:MAG: cadmium-translocating P-type ATPase, partial [Bacteroidetes bacterium]|nr:cadmium-translocating P-type ATPase [Bacteroidota bacterium]
MENNTIELKVDGMTCNNCASSLDRFLTRKGLEDVYVNFSTKEVRFQQGNSKISLDEVKAGIHKLGFTVVEDEKKGGWTLKNKLIISAIFTLPLLLHHLFMMAGIQIFPFFENYWIQFAVCLPVFILGFFHFGKSALSSLKGGVPNMDVLIFIGSTAAFIYSLVGTILMESDYIFYETSATIITLVLIGNWLEHRSVEQTTTAIKELSEMQVETARQVMPSGTVITINKDEINVGAILQVNEGDQIPSDGEIIEGIALLDESLLTGESIPVSKKTGDQVIGASLVRDGNLKMKVTATGKDTVIQQMIELVKTAQKDKPQIQRLADKISAIFVPAVVGIAFLAFFLAYFGFNIPFQKALMNSIAVLVISCPCAMGLATPTAVMVGVGRMAKNGILVRGGRTLETLASIKNMVFDKTGTLTTGQFQIKNIDYKNEDKQKINALIYALEKHSSHPIAESLVNEMKDYANGINFQELKEEKGKGIIAIDNEGHTYKIGAYPHPGISANDQSNIIITKNNVLLATIEIQDELKEETKNTIQFIKEHNINPIILSGDLIEKTRSIAKELEIKEYFGQQTPSEKLELIETLTKKEPTAMVGDGINDAAALARATLGISMSDASKVAIQSSQIVLLKGKLKYLQKALAISKHTLLTIKQNLFWAFAYN